jgi:aromatic ring-opening dioxygenase LigB subunit
LVYLSLKTVNMPRERTTKEVISWGAPVPLNVLSIRSIISVTKESLTNPDKIAGPSLQSICGEG